MGGTRLIVLLLVGVGCGSSRSGPPDAAAVRPDAGVLPARLLTNSVIAAGPEFVSMAEFRAYVDAMVALGIRDLHVFGAIRSRCGACGAGGGVLDIDTWPSPDVYDFRYYFERLDYAINVKGMRVVLSMGLAGRLDSDPGAPFAVVTTLPAHFGAGDLMMMRDADGSDVLYVAPPGSEVRVPSFENPAVRAKLLGYVSAVVTQFHARYGDWISYYSFGFNNTTAENEYPLDAQGRYSDTSPAAVAAFHTWLAAHYATPADVSSAWGRPAFTSFAEIEILDGKPRPAVGEAPRAYLDFMAYREAALGAFLGDLRDRIHAGGGRALAQYGAVADWISHWRGTYGFGRQAVGYDLLLFDDAIAYPHDFFMDYARTNGAGIPGGTELDPPCTMGCVSGDDALCCDLATFPANIDATYGMERMDRQITQTFAGGGAYVDLANWDFYYKAAFPLFRPSLTGAVTAAQGARTTIFPVAAQSLSLRELYVHHDQPSYFDDLYAAHAALANGNPVSVVLVYDLDP